MSPLASGAVGWMCLLPLTSGAMIYLHRAFVTTPGNWGDVVDMILCFSCSHVGLTAVLKHVA